MFLTIYGSDEEASVFHFKDINTLDAVQTWIADVSWFAQLLSHPHESDSEDSLVNFHNIPNTILVKDEVE